MTEIFRALLSGTVSDSDQFATGWMEDVDQAAELVVEPPVGSEYPGERTLLLPNLRYLQITREFGYIPDDDGPYMHRASLLFYIVPSCVFPWMKGV